MTPVDKLVKGTYPISIAEANEILKVSKKGYLPITDNAGNLCALTTRTDLQVRFFIYLKSLSRYLYIEFMDMIFSIMFVLFVCLITSRISSLFSLKQFILFASFTYIIDVM